MSILNIKSLFCLALTVLLLSSCSDEQLVTSNDFYSENNVSTQARDDNNRGDKSDRPDNQPGNNDADQQDTQLLQQWLDLFLDVERYTTGIRPNASARAIAYIQLAAYETLVPGLRDYESNSRKITDFNPPRYDRELRNIDWELALNTSFSITIKHFLANAPQEHFDKIDQLADRLEDSLTRNNDRSRRQDSKRWGQFVADQIIRYSLSDTEAEEQILEPQPLSYEPPVADGYWTYSADPERALFPYWESVRTFVVSTDETTTVDPIPYSTNPSSPYYGQMASVYEKNNQAKAHQGEGLWIGEFWSDDVEGIMMSPPARQISIASQLIDQYGLDLGQALHLLVKIGFALNDAAVSTWKYKYEHMVMRPNVFIHEFIDPNFQTNLFRLVYWPNPSFPGYPSGHSSFASASAGVFIDFFGDDTNFTDRTHEGRTEFLGSPRSYTSFSQMADENGYSRVPLGVHVAMDCTEGLRLGYEISSGINEYKLLREAM